MSSVVEDILEQYLEYKIEEKQQGYSDELRLVYDNDVKYYLAHGYSKEESLYADTVISFWAIYKQLLSLEANWTAYKTENSIRSLLRQTRSNRKNDYTSNIRVVNEYIEPFAKVVYSEGNYMLLPNRSMNIARNKLAEDRIDVTLFQSFSGGKLSRFFDNDNELRRWISREQFLFLFVDGVIEKDNLIWFVDNEKKVSEMQKPEIDSYINCSIDMIKTRNLIYRKCVSP